MLDNMPPRREIHVPVELSPLQCEYYRAMLTKNYSLLAGNAAKAARGTRLHNMVVQLRKVFPRGFPPLLNPRPQNAPLNGRLGTALHPKRP